jgi:hypothetical protein
MKHLFLPIAKVDKAERMVWGYASTPQRDYDGDVITLDAVKGALPGYMKFANVREMHSMSAVGVTKQANVDDNGLYIGAKIVDPSAWLKVQEEVYKGFSIGGNATARDPGDHHTITGLELIEISLVDRPANPGALIEVYKVAQPKENTMAELEQAPAEQEAPADEQPLNKRQKLLESVEQLTDEQVDTAFEAFQKRQEAPTAPEAKAPVVEALVEKPAPVPPATAVAWPVRIAKRLKGDGAEAFQATVAKAIGFNPQQFAGILKLNEAGIANWLNNNTTIAESIRKACPDDSPLWQSTTPEQLGELKTHWDVIVTKADDKSKPEGEYGSAADAGYADPGYQEDKKPRYPLKEGGEWSDGRIRAAWNYINKNKNQEAYSAEQVSKIKAKIIAAWKAHIDKGGPPSAEQKALNPNMEYKNVKLNELGPDAKNNLRKGLIVACALIDLLDRLDGLQKTVAMEAVAEQDQSQMPARLEELLKMFAGACQDLLSEEVGEMLNNREAAEWGSVGMPSSFIAYADKAQNLLKLLGGGAAKAELFTKAIGDRTGAPGFNTLTKFAEDVIAKANAAPKGESADWSGTACNDTTGTNDTWVRKAQSIHDSAVTMGATCSTEKVAAEAKPPAETKAKKPAVDAEDQADQGADEDTEGEDKNPAEPKKTKKAAAVAEPAPAPASNAGLEALTKTVTEFMEEFRAARKNPALPGKAVRKTEDVNKVASPDDDDGKPKDPNSVLKAQLRKPNFASL